MKTLSKIILSLSLFLFIGTTGFGQNQNNIDYNDWDTNEDNKVNNSEFTSTLNENDLYNEWDANNDNQLDEDEWNEGVSTYYDDYNYDEDGTYEAWDTDSDNYISDDEFAEGTFDLWDDDDNGYVDNNEYDSWYWNDDGLF